MYGGRAVAKSVKTYAWRYMVRAEPFADEVPFSHFVADTAISREHTLWLARRDTLGGTHPFSDFRHPADSFARDR